MLSDQIKEIVASRELIDVETEQNESVRKEQASSDAAKLLDEISEWKPKFERAIELAASEVYTVLRKGLLISRGVRLPDPDVAISLKVLAKWEISATRNDREHYCHIHCLTDEVMFLFPLETVTTGESVDGLVRHGSFFVLSQNSAAAATLPRRSQARGRRGRPREYRWNDLHVEMAALVREGLPAKKDAAVEHLRELYRTRCGEPVPANRTLYDWVKPYYERYCRNSDR